LGIKDLKWGGLGIKDLEKFNRALRLRWLWHQWDEKEKPWKELLRVHDHKDIQLFFQSTNIHVENGKNTPWRQGGYMVLLPRSWHLSYTWYKLGIVENELMNSNWMKNLKEITTESRLHEFVLLFMALAL
jgi:hypothetical protein